MADEEAPRSAKGKSRRLGKQEDAPAKDAGADKEAPKAEGQSEKRPAKFLPYLGKDSLPRPASFDANGRPLDKDRKPFKPQGRFAVVDGSLVEYSIGRGGIKKRGKVSLKLSDKDRREKSGRFDYIAKLRAQLKRDGVPGA